MSSTAPYAGELFGFALNALGERGIAEELVQEVFTRAWRHAERYDPERGSVRTWLYQIARHAIIDTRRRAAVRPALAAARAAARGSEPPRDCRSSRRCSAGRSRWRSSASRPDHRQMIRLAHVQGLYDARDRRAAPTCRSAPSRAARGTRCGRCGSCSRRWGSGDATHVPRDPPAARRLRPRGARADEADVVRAHLAGLPRVQRRARRAGRASAACSTSPPAVAQPVGAARAEHRGGAARPLRARVEPPARTGPARASPPVAAARSRGRARASRSPAACSPPRSRSA